VSDVEPPRSRVPDAPAGALAVASGVVRGLARTAVRLAIVAAAAGAVAWWALARGIDPGELRTGVLVAAALVLAFPPVALVLFAIAARTLAELPGRIREAPGALKERAGEISRRATALTEARRRGGLRSVPALARLWWSVSSVRDVLQVAGPGVVLLTPAVLAAAVAAVPGAILEILLGLAGLLWLAA
jgi:hypothetical protein